MAAKCACQSSVGCVYFIPESFVVRSLALLELRLGLYHNMPTFLSFGFLTPLLLLFKCLLLSSGFAHAVTSLQFIQNDLLYLSLGPTLLRLKTALNYL